jgi:hypothetical protein
MKQFIHDHLVIVLYVPAWVAATLGAWVASR